MQSKIFKNCLMAAKEKLQEITGNEQEAWFEVLALMCFATKKTKVAVYACMDELVGEVEFSFFNELLHKRITHRMPLYYLIGTMQFLDLELAIQAPILIPRQETEEIVDWVIKKLKPLKHAALRILDLCTGSGCIALALAKAFPCSTVIGIDSNPDAVVLARENAKKNGLYNVEFLEGSFFDPLPNEYRCDFFIANPPYIAEKHYEELQKEVKNWEDKQALVADNNGMACYQKILENIDTYLDKKSLIIEYNIPSIVFEVGIDQGSIVSLSQSHGYRKNQLFYDMHNQIRWIAIWV